MTRVEASLERLFATLAKQHGGLAFKIDASAMAGAPDRLLLLPGHDPFLVELKTTKGALEPHQRRLHERLEGKGFRVHTLYGAEQIRAFFASVSGAGGSGPSA